MKRSHTKKTQIVARVVGPVMPLLPHTPAAVWKVIVRIYQQ